MVELVLLCKSIFDIITRLDQQVKFATTGFCLGVGGDFDYAARIFAENALYGTNRLK